MLRFIVFAATQSSPAGPADSPISLLFKLLQTPLPSSKPQLIYFQSILDSLHKTPGVGVPFRLSSPPLLGTEQRLTDHDLSPMSIFFFSNFPFSRFPYSLPSSVSRNSCVLPLLRKIAGGVPHSSQNGNGNAATEARQENPRNAATQVQPRIRT